MPSTFLRPQYGSQRLAALVLLIITSCSTPRPYRESANGASGGGAGLGGDTEARGGAPSGPQSGIGGQGGATPTGGTGGDPGGKIPLGGQGGVGASTGGIAGNPSAGSGGIGPGAGGHAGGAAGSDHPTGGTLGATGGASAGNTGGVVGTGGALPGTGGMPPASGGVMGAGGVLGTGGAPPCTATNCLGVCESNGVCRGKLGQSCSLTAGGCLMGTTCVDGVCCGSAACGPCLNCGSTGSCDVPVANADDMSSISCTGVNTCDGTGQCRARQCSRTGCGVLGACISGLCQTARRVFVSSVTIAANFAAPTSLATSAADRLCKSFADAAGLGGQWKAWLSDSTSSPAARFEKSPAPYALLDGTIVASNWNGLISGALAHGIDMDETGATRSNAGVWTATDSMGAPLISGQIGTTYPIGDCTDFTANAAGPPYPAIGLTGKTDPTWSYVYLSGCEQLEHLYCFEQSQ